MPRQEARLVVSSYEAVSDASEAFALSSNHGLRFAPEASERGQSRRSFALPPHASKGLVGSGENHLS